MDEQNVATVRGFPNSIWTKCDAPTQSYTAQTSQAALDRTSTAPLMVAPTSTVTSQAASTSAAPRPPSPQASPTNRCVRSFEPDVCVCCVWNSLHSDHDDDLLRISRSDCDDGMFLLKRFPMTLPGAYGCHVDYHELDEKTLADMRRKAYK